MFPASLCIAEGIGAIGMVRLVVEVASASGATASHFCFHVEYGQAPFVIQPPQHRVD